jgi:hypothetical protein
MFSTMYHVISIKESDPKKNWRMFNSQNTSRKYVTWYAKWLVHTGAFS